MARLSPASSTAVVDVPDALVEKYKAAGWVEVKPEKAEPKRTRSTAEKSE